MPHAGAAILRNPKDPASALRQKIKVIVIMVKKVFLDHFSELNATILIARLSYLGLPALEKEAAR